MNIMKATWSSKFKFIYFSFCFQRWHWYLSRVLFHT